MGFSRQRYWSGLPFPSPEALPDPRIKPASLALQVNSLPSETPGKPFWILTALYLFTAQDFNRSIPLIFLYFVTAICGYVLSGASLVGPKAKNLSAMQETWVPPLGQQDPPGKGNGYPLQYSCLEYSMDRGAWWATVHRVTKSWTRLSD